MFKANAGIAGDSPKTPPSDGLKRSRMKREIEKDTEESVAYFSG
jgi:hypothetical protein